MEEPVVEKIKTEPQPDWTIDELYRKAWTVVKNNKVLWIFAAAAGGGLSLNNSFRINGDDFTKFQEFFQKKPVTPTAGKLTQVLGAIDTQTPVNTMSDVFGSLFSAIPVWMYILLALEILLLILIGIGIAVVYQNWATGALLENIQTCINGGKATIQEASEKAFGYIKPLIFLQIVPGLIISLAALIGFAVLGVGFAAASGVFKVLFAVLLFSLTITAIYAFIMLAVTLIWAPRAVVVEKKSARMAFSSGLMIARKKFWTSILLGVVNNILSLIIVSIPIAVILGIILGGAFMVFGNALLGSARDTFSIVWVIATLILIPLAVIGLTVLGAVLNSFKATVWSLAYNKIKGKYDI